MAKQRKLSIGERIIKRFGGLTAADAKIIERRAYEAGMSDAGDGNDEPALQSSDGFSISTGFRARHANPRDLSNISLEKSVEAAYRLWQTQPIAKAIIEIYVDYILGSGITLECQNEQVQQVLDKFWLDPVNALGTKDGDLGEGQEQLTRELFLFGELLIPVFVRSGESLGITGDGLARYSTIDVTQIHSIICDPKNRRDVLAVRLKSATGRDDGPVYKLVKEKDGGVLEGYKNWQAYRDIVTAGGEHLQEAQGQEFTEIQRKVSGKEWLVDQDPDTKRVRFTEAANPAADVKPVGEAFYFRVNMISTGARGRSDILPMIDWIDNYDAVFFDGVDHVKLLNAFSWDLSVTGGSETATEPEKNLRVQAEKVASLKGGDVYAHNEGTTLEAKNPELKTGEMETLVRQLRVFISGGARIPEHWIAEGGYTNRATAAEMSDPTYRMLRRKQAAVKNVFSHLCTYQIDVCVALGILPADVPVLDEDGNDTGDTIPAREAFHLNMPDISARDTQKAAAALASVAQAVLPLLAGQYLPLKPALELLAAVADALGVTLDVKAILDESESVPEADPTVVELLKAIKDQTSKTPVPGDGSSGDMGGEGENA